MTLFRKVFPNQARPATKDEQIDEEALRAAFTEMSATDHPLVLDPFEHGVDENAEHFPTGNEDPQQFGPLGSEHDRLQAPPGLEKEMSTQDNPERDGARDGTDSETLEDAHTPAPEAQSAPEAVQSDEEIAACLDRALAAGVPMAASSADDTEVSHLHDEAEPGESETPATEPADAPKDQQASKLRSNEVSADEIVIGGSDQKARTGETPEMTTGATERGQDPRQPYDEEESVAAPAADGARAEETKAPQRLEASTGFGAPLDLSQGVTLDAVPAPATGRASRRAGRVKTRLLGFNRGGESEGDPFSDVVEATATAQRERFPVGWLVIVEGPGIGHSFSLFTGASMIGRGEDQVIRLDFGDNAISRQNHAAIAYDEEQNKFYLGHGGKSNIIRRNTRPVLSTEELHHADLIRIGETTLRFVALCGSDFRWDGGEGSDAAPV
ncbi:MAG: FHA domain-containing protein [Pseudomonadota bacterium]